MKNSGKVTKVPNNLYKNYISFLHKYVKYIKIRISNKQNSLKLLKSIHLSVHKIKYLKNIKNEIKGIIALTNCNILIQVSTIEK